MTDFTTRVDAWVFAYGSNMHLWDLGQWLRGRGFPDRVAESHAAVLEGHRLVWNYYSRSRRGGAANVEPSTGNHVHGVLLGVSSETLAGIDAKEGHPNVYSRGVQPRRTRRASCGTPVLAWVYEVQPHWRQSRQVRPSCHYRRLMLEGAQAHGLPAAYLVALRALSTT